jgi:hypothetical protein
MSLYQLARSGNKRRDVLSEFLILLARPLILAPNSTRAVTELHIAALTAQHVLNFDESRLML